MYRTREDLLTAGWTEIVDDGFLGHVGPIWQRIDGSEATLGFLSEQKHKNRMNVVQGGMLATLLDRTLGFTARLAQPERHQFTIQLNIHYIAPARLGQFVSATGQLVRETRSLAFVSGRLEADGSLIGQASGVWRIRVKGGPSIGLPAAEA